MKNRNPRKGELNFKIQQLLMRAFRRSNGDATRALPFVNAGLSRIAKAWNIREVNVEVRSELVPVDGTWNPGPMTNFVDVLIVKAYRTRPNRHRSTHRIVLTSWPSLPNMIPTESGYNKNPQIHTMVNDGWL